jgi:hypothetical protein
MRFAHLADCHIGSWRDPKLRDISSKAFNKGVDICIEKNMDFIVIAGDLFNTSLPPLDSLKETVSKLKQLKDKEIAVYIVPGSHDFSPSGKTMLDVLENAGLLTNVAKGFVENNKLKLNFTIDKRTGAKITGMIGRKGMLEKNYYENLEKENLEKEQGYKIFIFHTALTEFKSKDLEKMDSCPLSLLPKNFNYYAGGHPHLIFDTEEQDYGLIAYPGPLFPNNFRELEKLGNGGFYIVENNKLEWQPVMIYNTYSIKINCENKTCEEIIQEILAEIKNKEFNDTIVTIRLEGTLKSGRVSDINFKEIFDRLYEKSAYFVMKNTVALKTKEFEEIKVDIGSVEDIEDSLIREHLGQIKLNNFKLKDEEKLTKELIKIFSLEKLEGERNIDFERRLNNELNKILNLW